MIKAVCKQPDKMSKPLLIALVFLASFLPAAIKPNKAEACCSCAKTVAATEIPEMDETVRQINKHTTSNFVAHRSWIISILWEDNILPAMMAMAEQLTAVAMNQVMIFGTFIDAQNQMQAQQALQTAATQAHKTYHPSTGMCEIGSAMQGLLASERLGQYNAQVLARRSQDRQLGQANTASAYGGDQDIETRVAQFRTTFCDPAGNNDGLGLMCDHDGAAGGSAGAQTAALADGDIDWAQIDAKSTLKVNFANGTLTDDEKTVLAMSSNLYSHNVLPRPGAALLESPDGELTNTQRRYMDGLALVAMNGVAESSFNAIIGMKSAGTGGGAETVRAWAEQMGFSPEEAEARLGENPSYYAMMEMLSKMGQDPDFYTRMYESPANVKRRKAAMEFIETKLALDALKSDLRKEAVLAVLLETQTKENQQTVENEMNPTTGAGREAGAAPAPP